MNAPGVYSDPFLYPPFFQLLKVNADGVTEEPIALLVLLSKRTEYIPPQA